MTTHGVVSEWHDDSGWGVIDAEPTPGGCWTHFSAVLADGFRALRTGQTVRFSYEEAEQDGYAFRAVDVWLPGQPVVTSVPEVTGPTEAYHSWLTLEFDEPLESPQDEISPSQSVRLPRSAAGDAVQHPGDEPPLEEEVEHDDR